MLQNKWFKTSMGFFCIFSSMFLVTILVLSLMRTDRITEPIGPPHNYWIPTEDDLIWIDSLQNQVKDIETDVNELNVSVNRIDRKLDDMIEEQSNE
jgi:hypothetical protein